MGSLNSHSSRRSEGAPGGMATVLASSSSNNNNNSSGSLEGRSAVAGAEGQAQTDSSSSSSKMELIHSSQLNSTRPQQTNQSLKSRSKTVAPLEGEPMPLGEEQSTSVACGSLTRFVEEAGGIGAQSSSKKIVSEMIPQDGKGPSRRSSSGSGSGCPDRGRQDRSPTRQVQSDDRRDHKLISLPANILPFSPTLPYLSILLVPFLLPPRPLPILLSLSSKLLFLKTVSSFFLCYLFPLFFCWFGHLGYVIHLFLFCFSINFFSFFLFALSFFTDDFIFICISFVILIFRKILTHTPPKKNLYHWISISLVLDDNIYIMTVFFGEGKSNLRNLALVLGAYSSCCGLFERIISKMRAGWWPYSSQLLFVYRVGRLSVTVDGFGWPGILAHCQDPLG
ncbi:hypothetical protein VP01_1256g1 [Puccinia sorghi]|uniref:Uncharacterized protein n=1 Tax=Puccinia sorghi TaxID=27349 RepID=A0A0L6VQS7_9BASI|nr:hypothetical protein VP01_1256g1 [Puccinia sorghi]